MLNLSVMILNSEESNFVDINITVCNQITVYKLDYHPLTRFTVMNLTVSYSLNLFHSLTARLNWTTFCATYFVGMYAVTEKFQLQHTYQLL